MRRQAETNRLLADGVSVDGDIGRSPRTREQTAPECALRTYDIMSEREENTCKHVFDERRMSIMNESS